MKVLFIYTNLQSIQFYHYHQGLGWLSAVLKQAGHRTELIYLDQEISPEQLVEKVKKISPDLIGFSSITLQYQFTKHYAQALKSELKIPMVIGGIHSTIAPEQVLADDLFDFLVQGEGEYPLLELVQALEQDKDWRNIKNLWWREENQIKSNPLRPLIELDQLPFPDRELFDEQRLLLENNYQVPMMASRGCPFACSYCCNTVLTQLAKQAGGRWHRRRSVEKVIQELVSVHKRYPNLKSVFFADEVFTSNKQWVREFCVEYKNNFKTPFQVYIRVGTVDYELLRLMKETGLYSILVGVESGNERIRREVLNRKMSNQQIREVFRWADELGIESWSAVMIGVPGETEKTIRETIKLVQKISPHHLQLSMFQPFPLTPLYEQCLKQGLLPEGDATNIYLNQPRLNLPELSKEKLSALYSEFQALGWLLEAKKGKKGYFDLSSEFDRARIQPGGEGFVKLWLVRIKGEDRLSILIHPPSKVSWQVKLRPDSKLRFGAGFSSDVWDKPGAGAYYLVRVKPRLGKPETIFSSYLDPKHNPEERKWNDFEVSLAKFGANKIELILETRTDGPNDWCVAFWSRPYLVQEGSEQ